MADYIREVVKMLEGWGATSVHVKKGRVHPKIVYTHKGRERFYVVPGSPSDRRALANCRSELRRILGVGRPTKSRSRPKRQRHAKPISQPDCPTLTVKPDPMEALKGHATAPAVLQMRADRAWRAFWDECMRRVS